MLLYLCFFLNFLFCCVWGDQELLKGVYIRERLLDLYTGYLFVSFVALFTGFICIFWGSPVLASFILEFVLSALFVQNCF